MDKNVNDSVSIAWSLLSVVPIKLCELNGVKDVEELQYTVDKPENTF
jgi:hypothetical protein